MAGCSSTASREKAVRLPYCSLWSPQASRGLHENDTKASQRRAAEWLGRTRSQARAIRRPERKCDERTHCKGLRRTAGKPFDECGTDGDFDETQSGEAIE